jgi:hypothetical protein
MSALVDRAAGGDEGNAVVLERLRPARSEAVIDESVGDDRVLLLCCWLWAVFVELASGTERMEVKEVKRGRMYENVDTGCCGGGGGVGGRGGGNHLWRDARARSAETCR